MGMRAPFVVAAAVAFVIVVELSFLAFAAHTAVAWLTGHTRRARRVHVVYKKTP